MQGRTLAKEMVQSFWMMWLVLEMRVGWLTASPIPLTTVSTVKMLESAAKLNVGSLFYFTRHTGTGISELME